MAAKFYISAEMLKRRGACSRQVDLFRRTFGNEAALTLENTRKAIDAGLALRWVAYLITNHTNGPLRDRALDLYEAIFDCEDDQNEAPRVLALLEQTGAVWAKLKAQEAR